MSFKSTSVKATKLSYNSSNDEYSSLVAKREELSAKIETYKATCESYEEQFDSQQKAIDDAKDNYKAVKRSTDQAIQSAQNTVDMQDYQADSGSTTATQLETLKKQLEACTVKAEKDGTVTSLSVSEGDFPAEGSTLMTIENDSQLKITVDIDEKDILKIKEGMDVVVTSDATGDQEIHGTVSKVITIISSGSTSADGTSSTGFTAEITIDEDCDLLVGMKAKAKIILVEKSGCYSVLYDCIMYDDDGTPYVLLADTSDGDGTATVKRIDVTVGDESGSYVEVSGDGLQENDLIITTPYEVNEGDILQIDPSLLDLDYSYVEDAEVVD
jgi:RND family efflux transporter MFP subunit